MVQNIECRIVIAIKDDPTTGTDVGPHRKRLVDADPTCRAVRRRPFGRDRDHRDIVHRAVGFDPGEELPPPGIVNGCETDDDS